MGNNNDTENGDYKISDFWDVLCSRTTSFFCNHLFCWFFTFFIVIIGSFGIWVKPVFIDEFDSHSLMNSFNTLNLLSFSLPLIVTLLFDKVVTIVAKGKVDDPSLLIWFVMLGMSALLIVVFLFFWGLKSSLSLFSWPSFFAWLLVLYFWVICNVDNPNYQKVNKNNATQGGNDVDYNKLKD
jgi:hypothetical protein